MDFHWLTRRIRQDYLIAPRHEEYRQILECAHSQRYQVVSLREAYSPSGEWAHQRVLGLRHDVDTNNRQGVRLFLQLEKEFGVTATYYFRLETLGMADLIREIQQYGSEVGYHFEEPASVAKQHRIASSQELHRAENRSRVDQMMEHNIRRVNAQLGLPIRSLCSHNDFYNRRLQVENYAFLSDHIRQQFNILFEVNDAPFLGLFGRYHSDVSDDSWLWRDDESPVKSMLQGVPRILVLTHPRQWHPAPVVNTRENLQRLLQELYCRALGV